MLSGVNEGADTIRFASTSAHTLDLNGGTMAMVYGGVLIAQDVTQAIYEAACEVRNDAEQLAKDLEAKLVVQ